MQISFCCIREIKIDYNIYCWNINSDCVTHTCENRVEDSREGGDIVCQRLSVAIVSPFRQMKGQINPAPISAMPSGRVR